MYNFYLNNCLWPFSGRGRQFLRIMKITTLLIVVVILHVSAASVAQKVTLKEKNAPLIDVFNQIRSQTGYDFAFTSDALKDTKPVTIDVKNQELTEVLKEITADENLEFAIDNKIVVIRVKEESLLSRIKGQIAASLAQVTVTGQVVDELGQPMVGVTVKEKTNPGNATATDAKGRYTLTVSAANAVVVFSFVGYEPKEIAANQLGNGSVITLVATSTNLHEVVVNKGYYFERSELSTAATTRVDAKTIEEQPVTDPIQALEGRVPGLFIQQASGNPGASSVVRLRGISSIANGNDPLYIVDGVPYGSTTITNPFGPGDVNGAATTTTAYRNNGRTVTGSSPFNNINPGDIESIEVLKDADATAIYGSRGANGVILITTKKGKAGDTKVNLDISQGSGKVTRMLDMMNTQQYLQMRHEAYKNDGITTIPANAYDINGAWDTTRYTNWQKVLIGNTAHYTNAQISVSGGNENTQFYIGGGYNRQTTVYPGDNAVKKGSLNFNITQSSLNKRFRLQFSGGYVNNNSNLPGTDLTGIALGLAPDAPALYNANGSLNWQPVGGTATWNNPMSYSLINTTQITNTLTSNLTLSYQVLPGLVVKSSLGYTHQQSDQGQLTPASSFPPPTNTDPNARGNFFASSMSQSWIIEPQISYDRKIGKGRINALVGSTIQQNMSNASGYYTYYYQSDALLSNPLNAGTSFLYGFNNTLYRYNAAYARIGYTWDDKYLLNLTARRDGSSRFGPGKQWGNFGAIGLGWIFSNEKFVVNNLPWLSFGKLRSSYGITGNDQITDYQYLSTYNSNSTTYQGLTYLTPARISNPYYSWEVNKKLEIGLELGFLKDRLSLVADYYRNRSGNQLVGYPLTYLTGFTTIQENLPAVVQNTGLELTINTINVKSDKFSWTSSISLSVPQNKLVSYPDLASSTYANTYVIGQSLFIRKQFAYAGVDPQTGKYEFYNINGQTTFSPTSPADLQATKPITQQYFGGFQNSLTYGSFSLDIFIQFVKQISDTYRGTYNAGTVNQNQPVAIFDNHWQKPGDVATYGEFSTKSGADPNFKLSNSPFGVGDASYIRLKNVAFSYALPKQWQQGAHLQNARIYLQAQNLLTITNYFGIDPESGSAGLPPLRMLTLGVKASL